MMTTPRNARHDDFFASEIFPFTSSIWGLSEYSGLYFCIFSHIYSKYSYCRTREALLAYGWDNDKDIKGYTA